MALVLLALGAILCLLNVAGIIADGGEFFFGPALSVFSMLLFAAGAVISALSWYRRRRWAGLLALLNLLGIVVSIVLGCAGMPKR